MIRTLNVDKRLNFWGRVRGIKGGPHPARPIYLPSCKAVHTFGVKRPLTLVWLNREDKVIRVHQGVKANRIRFCLRAAGVLEEESYKSGTFKAGDQLKLRGQALVETALVLPVLFLLLLGFLELSLLLQAQQKLTHTTHWATQVLALTNNEEKLAGAILDFYEPDAVQVEIESQNSLTQHSIAAINRRHKDLVTVKTQLDYVFNMPFLSRNSFAIDAQATARILCQETVAPYQCD